MWLFIIALFASIGAAIVSGVSVSTLLFFGLALLCPAAMFFGMRGANTSHARGHSGSNKCSERDDDTESEPAWGAA